MEGQKIHKPKIPYYYQRFEGHGRKMSLNYYECFFVSAYKSAIEFFERKFTIINLRFTLTENDKAGVFIMYLRIIEIHTVFACNT